MVKQAIAKYVEQNGIKQIFIAQRTGIPPQSVGLLLKGERNLDVEEYAKICDAFGVPYDFFFKDDEEKSADKAS